MTYLISIMIVFPPIVSAAIFVGLLRKLSPPTNEVKKLKFFLVFFSSLSIPILNYLISLAYYSIITSGEEALLKLFYLVSDATMTGVILVLLTPLLTALSITLISLLLKLYVFEKRQVRWFISTVLIGFLMPIIMLFFVGGQNLGVGVILWNSIYGAICSFSSALVLTVFPKPKQENNE